MEHNLLTIDSMCKAAIEMFDGETDFVALFFLTAETYDKIANVYLFDDGDGLYPMEQDELTGHIGFVDEAYKAAYLGTEVEGDDGEYPIELKTDVKEDGTTAYHSQIKEGSVMVSVTFLEENGMETNNEYYRAFMKEVSTEYSGEMHIVGLFFACKGTDSRITNVAEVFMKDAGSGVLLQSGDAEETDYITFFDEEYKQYYLDNR